MCCEEVKSLLLQSNYLHTTPSWITTRTLTLAVQIWSLQSVPSHWPHLLTIHFLILKASPLPRNYLSADHQDRKSIVNPLLSRTQDHWNSYPCLRKLNVNTCGYSHHMGLLMSKTFMVSYQIPGSFWASHFRMGNTIFQPLSSYNLLPRGQHCELCTCQHCIHPWVSTEMNTMGQGATQKPHGEDTVTERNQNCLPKSHPALHKNSTCKFYVIKLQNRLQFYASLSIEMRQ